jgi:hypothetical protein
VCFRLDLSEMKIHMHSQGFFSAINTETKKDKGGIKVWETGQREKVNEQDRLAFGKGEFPTCESVGWYLRCYWLGGKLIYGSNCNRKGGLRGENSCWCGSYYIIPNWIVHWKEARALSGGT